MEKAYDEEEVSKEIKNEAKHLDSTPAKKPKPTQQITTSTLGVNTPQHSLIPIASQEIKSIFSTQIIEPID